MKHFKKNNFAFKLQVPSFKFQEKTFTPRHFYITNFTHPPFSKKSGGGFTLIEVIIAISVMAIGVLGIYALVPKIVSISGTNLNKFIASQLAREGIEIVRNIRDTNWLEQTAEPANPWDEGLTDCSGGCEADYNTPSQKDPILTSYGDGRYLKVDANGFYNYENGTSTKFKRKITITPNADILNVKVEVTWSGKGSPFILEENLYNWH